MPAILFGSISTIADTSELQRQAFNAAFEAHGLDWRWDRDEYVALLEHSGGRDRIAEVARSLGQEVDADAVHATKSELFRSSLAEAGVPARAGVVETLEEARGNGVKVGLVTTTSPENVAALLASLGPTITTGSFDVVVDVTSVDAPKPAGDAYAFALRQLGEEPDAAVAIEDNLDGVRAAVAADVTCVAFPNANTAGHDFAGAARQVDHLSFEDLRQVLGAS